MGKPWASAAAQAEGRQDGLAAEGVQHNVHALTLRGLERKGVRAQGENIRGGEGGVGGAGGCLF